MFFVRANQLTAMKKRLFIVANQLPVQVSFNDKKHEIIYEDLGAITLKGKDEKLELLKIHMSGASYAEGRKEIEQVLNSK